MRRLNGRISKQRAGTTLGCAGFSACFRGEASVLREIQATEVSDGSTGTKGQYRVIGLDPVDTLTWPSGPLRTDCETFDKALDLAASNDELYLWIYIYNDNGEILHEAGCYRSSSKGFMS